MTFELLISAVNKDPEELARTMRIASDALIVVQDPSHEAREEEAALQPCGDASPVSEEAPRKDPGRSRIRCFRQKGRGVGRSRNAALSHAQADICLFGDEDIIYDDGYEERILSAFASHPEASVITFNVRVDERRRTYWNGKPHRIRWYNYGRYPAYAIAVRRRDILKNNIRYSTLFGGGARYSNGEDSLFLHDCLKAGLVLFADTAVLGEETYRESTWFRGYTDKFFYDRGVLYHFLYGKAAAIFGLRFLLANRKEMLKECSLSRAYALLRKGIGKGSEL